MTPYGYRFSASSRIVADVLQREVKFYPCIVNLAPAYHLKWGSLLCSQVFVYGLILQSVHTVQDIQIVIFHSTQISGQ